MTTPDPRPGRDPDAGFWTLFGRGLRRRCARCGRAPAFSGPFRMADHCSECGFVFEREPGFWVGAMIINTIISFGALLIVFVGGWIVFWPDVPWSGLMAATIAVALVVPIAGYSLGKSLWSAIELSYHQLDEDEQARARERAHRSQASESG